MSIEKREHAEETAQRCKKRTLYKLLYDASGAFSPSAHTAACIMRSAKARKVRYKVKV